MSAPSLLRGVLRSHWRVIWATVLLSATAAGAGVGLLAVSGWLLTGAALTTAGLGFNLFAPSALVRGLSLVRILSRYGEKVVGHDLALRLVADVRDRLFRRLAGSAPSGNQRLGDLVSRILAEVNALDALFVGVAGPMAAALGVGAALTALLLAISRDAGAVYLSAFAAAAFGLPVLLLTMTRTSAHDLLLARATLRTLVLDAAAGHADLTLFGRRGAAEAEVARATDRIARLERRRATASALALGTVALIGGATAIGVFLLVSPDLDGPAAVGITLATMASFEAAAILVRVSDRVGLALAATARMEAPLEPSQAMTTPEATSPLPGGADLVVEDLWFWRGPGRCVFQGASLNCPTGSRTAILGASGSGKSTLFDLVVGSADPSKGTIRVAGTDVVSVAPHALHTRVALMAQGVPVFLGTVRDNLLLGCPEADDHACWEALRRARLAATVRDMPAGLDTWCGEGGRTLSAGQARRLCLARTLLTGAEILLLDEPTAGLDVSEERSLLSDLADATAGRTVIIATHRTPPAGCVDRVVRIENGRFGPVTSEAHP